MKSVKNIQYDDIESRKFFRILFLIFITYYLLLFTSPVLAVDYFPLVPCGLNQPPKGGDPNWNYVRSCTTCDSFKLAKNVIDFTLQGLVPPIAVLLFLIGGFLILFGGPRPNWYEWGKKIFWDTFIGLIIIFSAWLIINTIIKTLGPEQAESAWYKFTCTEAVRPGLPKLTFTDICSRPEELAKQNNVPYPPNYPTSPGVNAPELDVLIACIRSKLPNEDLGDVFTFEEQNPLCNFTRGQEFCGRCVHEVNSCHYGGATGTQGALAVDFGNEKIGDKIIKAAQDCGGKDPRCEGANYQRVACSDPSATHVHVNSQSCGRN